MRLADCYLVTRLFVGLLRNDTNSFKQRYFRFFFFYYLYFVDDPFNVSKKKVFLLFCIYYINSCLISLFFLSKIDNGLQRFFSGS